MSLSFLKFGSSLSFSRLFRQLEQGMETVVNVLKPGPLCIIEHKFSAEEIYKANATVNRAVRNWEQIQTLNKLLEIIYSKITFRNNGYQLDYKGVSAMIQQILKAASLQGLPPLMIIKPAYTTFTVKKENRLEK